MKLYFEPGKSPRKRRDSSRRDSCENIINIDPEESDNIVETGNKEPVGEVAIVEKEETSLQAEIKASNERIKLMDQLQRKLKTKKTMVTKNLKKVETAIDAFQKVGADGESATVIKMEAEEVVTSVENLKESKEELESVSTSLQDVICESKPNELKGISPDDAITKVEEEL